MRSLEEIKTPYIVHSLAMVGSVLFVILIILLFVPWRQTVTGEGKVTVFSPMQRPQKIKSQIDARISQWYIKEGQEVKKGQLLLQLEEVKPKYLDKNQLTRLKGQQSALEDKRLAVENLIKSLQSQIKSLTQVQDAAVPNADLKIKQSSDKLRASQQDYNAAEQAFKTAEINFERRKLLFEKGLSSKRDFELAELKIVETRSKLAAAKAKLDIAERDINISKFDFSKVSAEAALKIQQTEAKLAQSYEKLAGIDSDILKLAIDISNFESRIEQRKVFSPIDGQVFRLRAFGKSETIKAGSELAVIAPQTLDQAIEIYVGDYFAPLVEVGRPVRIQFSGFPALQFGGWPNIEIGSFAGRVAVIDAAAEKEDNKYRILVKPDLKRIQAGKDEPWPLPENLRPGTKAIGWVILDEVPMWYELWRILNGFPPSIMYSPSKAKTAKIKV